MTMRIGIIGFGIMGQLHYKACAQHAGCEVVAIANRGVEKRELAEKWGIAGRYELYSEMLSKEKLDLVIVATPDRHHLDPVISALKAGCDVLVEKPLAPTVAEAKEMEQVAAANGRKVVGNFTFRMDRDIQHIKQAIAGGSLGDVQYVNIRISDRIEVATEMLNWGGQSSPAEFLLPHSIDLARYLTGLEIESLTAFEKSGVLKSKGIDTHDMMHTVATMTGGARLLLESSWILPESYPSLVDFFIEIHGTKGSIRLDRSRGELSSSAAKFENPITWLSFLSSGVGIGFFFDALHQTLDYFAGKAEAPVSSFQDAMVNTTVLEAILKSASTGEKVEF